MLNIARHCGLAPKLAEQYPEASPAADRGTEIHRAIAAGLSACEMPADPDAKAAVQWILGRAEAGAQVIGVERPVALADPETGDEITAGTVDVAVRVGEIVECIDWKTGRPENVPSPSENLQLAAYGLALALAEGASAYRATLVFLRDGQVEAVPGPVVEGEAMWAALAEVKAAASKPPVATPGAHCGGCYQRAVCPSWRERATTALSLLPKAGADMALTDEKAADLIVRVQAVREACDLAEEMVRAHVKAGGRVEAGGKVYGPQMVNGRRSGPTVKELEAQGLGHLVREGKPYERWGWSRA